MKKKPPALSIFFVLPPPPRFDDLLITRESCSWLPTMLAPLRIGIRIAAIAVIPEIGSDSD